MHNLLSRYRALDTMLNQEWELTFKTGEIDTKLERIENLERDRTAAFFAAMLAAGQIDTVYTTIDKIRKARYY